MATKAKSKAKSSAQAAKAAKAMKTTKTAAPAKKAASKAAKPATKAVIEPTAPKPAKAQKPLVQKPDKAVIAKPNPAGSSLGGGGSEAAQSTAAAKLSLKGVEAKKPRGKKKSDESGEKLTQLGQKWSALYRKAQEQSVPAYNMRQSYEAKTSIMHKVLGWGYIMTNKNDRLEVLFKDGIRYLISNYKA